MTPIPKRDEVEAVARAMFEARNKHLKNCYSWDDAELDNEHPDCRPALYRDANAAIAVLSAFRGQPCADLLRSVEATLEAVRDIPPNPATRMMIDEDLEKLRSAIAALDESRMGKPAGVNQFGMLPCPFCGGEGEPDGWSSTDRSGPACQQCDATADTMELWNSRPGIWTQEDIDEAIKKGGEMAAFFEASDPIDESRARDKRDGQAVVIDYTNYRGEKAYRKVVPIRLDFAETEWHPGKQWLMWAFDVDKNDVRAFAMDSIHSWFREFPTPHAAEIITPAPGQSEAIRAEVIAQGVDPNSDKAERMGRAIGRNMLRKATGEAET